MLSSKRQKLTDTSPWRNQSDHEPMENLHSSFGSNWDFPNGNFGSSSRQSGNIEYIMLKPSKKKVLSGDGDDLFAYKPSPEARNRMKAALEEFHIILAKIVDERNAKSDLNIGLTTFEATRMAAKKLFEQHSSAYVAKQLGHIAGVEIGDTFQSRAELQVVGLHHLPSKGIDCTMKDGDYVAACIVDSNRYENEISVPEKLIYVGEGGNPAIGCKKLVDQKMTCGNRALSNSIRQNTPVRVVYGINLSKDDELVGVSGKKITNKVYVYDGLYDVWCRCQERGNYNKLIYKFMLTRVAGQPKVGVLEYMKGIK